MSKTEVTSVNGMEIETSSMGTFVLKHMPEEGEFKEGDELEVSQDPQMLGYEIVQSMRTEKKYSFPIAGL